MSDVKTDTIRGVKWGLIQKLTMHPVQLMFSLLLARMITPEEMGIVGLTAIFFAVAAQLKDAGFAAALIQKQDRSEVDCSTVFWFNVLMSFLMAAVLYVIAPLFASFYKVPELTNVTRVSALMLFLSSTGGVHWALYTARRDFKTPALIGMFTTLIAMPVTLLAAYNGWSYWSLVLHGVITSCLSLISVWCISPWRPQFVFSFKSFKAFWSYGSKLLASGLIWTIYSESRTFVIGKFYSAAQLACYTRAHQLNYTPIHLITGILNNVTFPILSSIQSDKSRLYSVYRKYIRLTSLLCLFPMMFIAFNSDNVVYCLFGENWMVASKYVKIICFGAMFDPVAHVAVQIYLVTGRTDLSLRREILLRTFAFLTMILGAMHSVEGICYALIAACMANAFISMHYVTVCTQITVREQIGDVWRYLAPAFGCSFLAYFVSSCISNAYVALFCGLMASLFTFVAYLYVVNDVFAKDVLKDFINYLKTK